MIQSNPAELVFNNNRDYLFHPVEVYYAKRRRRKTFCAAQIVASNISKALRVLLLSRERNLKKTKFRPSRTPRAMNSKHAQTRYQLVQTYFINISTTNHRARAVRIHPSRAVFLKDEKFSESLYILGGNPKKSSSNARKQKAKERGISRSIHARAIQTMLYHLSLSLSLSRS